MNEKPIGLPMDFGEALARLARVRKSSVGAKKAPEKPKAARAPRVKRKSG
jgi:hypothetical protein